MEYTPEEWRILMRTQDQIRGHLELLEIRFSKARSIDDFTGIYLECCMYQHEPFTPHFDPTTRATNYPFTLAYLDLKERCLRENKKLYNLGYRNAITYCMDGAIDDAYVYPRGFDLAIALGIEATLSSSGQSVYQHIEELLDEAIACRCTIDEIRQLRIDEENAKKKLSRRLEAAGVMVAAGSSPQLPPKYKAVEGYPAGPGGGANVRQRLGYLGAAVAFLDRLIDEAEQAGQANAARNIRRWHQQGLSANEMAERLGGRRTETLALIRETLQG